MNKKGFTLAELLIVVAIIAVLVAISIPVFTTQLEKSREATDLANVRSAYAEVMNAAILDDENSSLWDGNQYVKTVDLKQTQDGWTTTENLNIGGIEHTDSIHWIGDPGKTCIISYDTENGIVLTWNGKSNNTTYGSVNTTTSNIMGGGLWSKVSYNELSGETAMYQYLKDVKSTLGNDVGLLKIRLGTDSNSNNYIVGMFYTNLDKTTYTFYDGTTTTTGKVSDIQEGTDLYKYYKLTYKEQTKYMNSDYAGWYWK